MKENKEVYKNLKQISEVLNKNFQQVFKTESDFKQTKRYKITIDILEIRIKREEIMETMKELDERKATDQPDGISGYILKWCRQEIAEPIWDIIECSLKAGKVPME